MKINYLLHVLTVTLKRICSAAIVCVHEACDILGL